MIRYPRTEMDASKGLWLPWAQWEQANMDFPVSDVDFLAADTNNDLALIVMTATKKE